MGGARATAEALAQAAVAAWYRANPDTMPNGPAVVAPDDPGAGLGPVVSDARNYLPRNLPDDKRVALERASDDLVWEFKEWDWNKVALAGDLDQLRLLASQLAYAVTNHLDSVRAAAPGFESGMYAEQLLQAVVGLSGDLGALENHDTNLVRTLWELEAEGRQAKRSDIEAAPKSNLADWLIVPLGGISGTDGLKKTLKSLGKALENLNPNGNEVAVAKQLQKIMSGITTSRAALETLDQGTRDALSTRLTVVARIIGRATRNAVLS